MKDYVNGWFYQTVNWRGHFFVCGPVSAEELLNLLKKGELNNKRRTIGVRSCIATFPSERIGGVVAYCALLFFGS
jgi:hypothetical protein